MMAQATTEKSLYTNKPRSQLIDAPTDLLCSHFTGRMLELEQLQSAFSKGSDRIPSRAAVFGMPGLGKTQLALKYAASAYTYRYSHIFWISAASVGKIREGYETILDSLELPERFSSEQHLKVAAVKRWLEDEHLAESPSWLLIFDNAKEDTVHTIREILPKSNPKGNILFTSRSEAVANALTSAGGKIHYCQELSLPEAFEAASMFLRSAGLCLTSPSGPLFEQCMDVVKHLGYLPLAMDQAASFIKQSRLGLEDLLMILNSADKPKVSHSYSDGFTV